MHVVIKRWKDSSHGPGGWAYSTPKMLAEALAEVAECLPDGKTWFVPAGFEPAELLTSSGRRAKIGHALPGENFHFNPGWDASGRK